MRLRSLTIISTLIACTLAQNDTNGDNKWSFNCSSLAPQGPSDGQDVIDLNYLAPSDTTFRVSKALICPSDATDKDGRCRLEPDGHLSLNATVNVTDIPDTSIFAPMIQEILTEQGWTNLTVTLPSPIRRFDGYRSNLWVLPGKAGYVAFTPTMRCFNGTVKTLSSCKDLEDAARRTADAFDGRALQICIPTFKGTPKRRARLQGTLAVVYTSEEEARATGMDVNPALSEEEQEAEDEDDEPGETQGGGGNVTIISGVASISSTRWWSVWLGGSVTVAVAGLMCR